MWKNLVTTNKRKQSLDFPLIPEQSTENDQALFDMTKKNAYLYLS